MQAVLDAFKDQKKVLGGVLLCCMRNAPEFSDTVVDLALKFRDKGVFGIDLAGDERLPLAPHAPAFHRAKEAGLAITIHAGEMGSAENIQEAIDLGATRIGHGTAAKNNPRVLNALQNQGVAIESCLQSNLDTKAISRVSDYPIRTFLSRNIRMTLNTDDRLMSNIGLMDEYKKLVDANVPLEDILTIVKNGILAAFAPVQKTLLQEFDQVLRDSKKGVFDQRRRRGLK